MFSSWAIGVLLRIVSSRQPQACRDLSSAAIALPVAIVERLAAVGPSSHFKKAEFVRRCKVGMRAGTRYAPDRPCSFARFSAKMQIQGRKRNVAEDGFPGNP
jgi:hypothetical protein